MSKRKIEQGSEDKQDAKKQKMNFFNSSVLHIPFEVITKPKEKKKEEEEVCEQCSICLESYKDPVTLECGNHTFCKTCICTFFEKTGTILPRCPLCKRIFTLNVQLRSFPSTPSKEFKEEEEKKLEEIKKLRNVLEKRDKSKVLQISKPWDELERIKINEALNLFNTTETRKQYCSLIGMTKENVENMKNDELMVACKNLGISVPDLPINKEIGEFMKQRLGDVINACIYIYIKKT